MKPVHPIQRFVRHLSSHPWQVRRYFSAAALQRIEQAIADSEHQHAGEIRVVIESGLPVAAVLQGVSPRQRAIQLFGQLNIWDTEHNNGVLVYLMLADRDVEIVADRGIHRHVREQGWQHICQQMEGMFRSGHFEQGITHGITAIGQHLAAHFPPEATPRNELCNRVLVL
ncbi:TPM domain-containing protein [Methylophilus aquaticus]|uniref:TPM domain-containing protein n=1 Tax=Methylophilus aquaticus TaxID=1971610 RepID=A0ABT9JQD7_9PROT|nr:TPM domain-containing protein [Methylophilus aquaticus]MDP8566779.1 TPM domain-containing protein [Methylophilus aquaticus]